MDISVVSLGRIHDDPRSSNLLKSVAQWNRQTSVLEIQTVTPQFRVILAEQRSSTIESTVRNEVPCFRTWSSRHIARKRWLTAVSAHGLYLGDLSASAIFDSHYAADAYWMNQFALAYAALGDFAAAVYPELPTVVVAEDLASAAGALLLRPLAGWRVMYDAHELFAESLSLTGDLHSTAAIQFFGSLERAVWAGVDSLITVSPGLARYISDAVPERSCLILPNLSPLASQQLQRQVTDVNPPKYVYSGGVAPFRQVDILVRNWPDVEDGPQLHLYLAPSHFADAVTVEASTNPNVHVHSPVSPHELIAVHSLYDVGVVPYNYPHPYDQASPNKFGEYLAAGLAILCEEGTWVADLIDLHQIGAKGSFSNQTSLTSLLNEVTHESLTRWKSNARESFRLDLNWDVHVAPVENEMERLVLAGRTVSSSTTIRKLPNIAKSELPGVLVEILLEKCRPLLLALYRRLNNSRYASLIPQRLVRRVA